jgi:MoaA/NifB/PqqE/SkfB family radical SAM enzyme
MRHLVFERTPARVYWELTRACDLACRHCRAEAMPEVRSLRTPEAFHGRCGVCGFREVCGGSRARAYAATGDPMGEDPLCAHDPAVAS